MEVSTTGYIYMFLLALLIAPAFSVQGRAMLRAEVSRWVYGLKDIYADYKKLFKENTKEKI